MLFASASGANNNIAFCQGLLVIYLNAPINNLYIIKIKSIGAQ